MTSNMPSPVECIKAFLNCMEPEQALGTCHILLAWAERRREKDVIARVIVERCEAGWGRRYG